MSSYYLIKLLFATDANFVFVKKVTDFIVGFLETFSSRFDSLTRIALELN